MRTARALAEDVAEYLASIEGVVAVAMGGSWARRRGMADSSIDLAVYYDETNPPPLDGLLRAARELDDRNAPEVVTAPGEWGPWVNGGARLRHGRREVAWYYRELGRMEQAIQDCKSGSIACEFDARSAESVCSHVYMGEVHYCRPLYDPQNRLAALKAQTAEYPPLLRQALIKRFLAAANHSLAATEKSAMRGDTFHAVGGFFRCVKSLIQVLYALNRQYFTTEKGAVGEAGGFLFRPPRFTEVVNSVLSAPGQTNAQLHKNLRRLRGLVRTVHKLCAYYAPGSVPPLPRGAS